ncbi:hypothetical protein ACLVWU_05765 [Bdellovibrio sp. HCB290]|uniref:hypothetical protein n=1 Tax=Bdellovibrio sp. HCB290 TaxID=3394356 RepID=UPI0039B6D94D
MRLFNKKKMPAYTPLQIPVYREKRYILLLPSALLVASGVALVTLCPIKDAQEPVKIFSSQAKKQNLKKAKIANNSKPLRSPGSIIK